MRIAVAGFALAGLVLAGCSAPAPEPTPSPSAIPLRTVTACGSDVVVPEASFGAEPSAEAPPTVTLRVGASVSFAVPAGARVGIIPSTNAGDDAQVCSAPPRAGTEVYVALQPGYLRIGIQTGINAPLRVFVKVTS